jgi:hypothetical protein
VDDSVRITPGRPLRIPDSRRLRYFGFIPSHNDIDKLNGWIRASSSMTQRRGASMQHILTHMELIRRRIDLRPLFRDWYFYAFLLQKHRLTLQKRSYKCWKALYYAIKYRILDRLVSRMHIPLMRSRFHVWVDETAWLRATNVDERKCKRRHMDWWREHAAAFRLGRLVASFRAWRERARLEALSRRLRVSLALHLMKLYGMNICLCCLV